jgi:uncharacterized protein with HEPN domain
MTAKNDTIFLVHILDSIEKIEKYISGVSRSSFNNDTLVQDGIIRQLEVIGEAVKNISSAIRDVNDHIPWQDIAGMRDKLIHHYFGVDIDQIWETVKGDIPILKASIQSIINSIE